MLELTIIFALYGLGAIAMAVGTTEMLAEAGESADPVRFLLAIALWPLIVIAFLFLFVWKSVRGDVA